MTTPNDPLPDDLAGALAIYGETRQRLTALLEAGPKIDTRLLNAVVDAQAATDGLQLLIDRYFGGEAGR